MKSVSRGWFRSEIFTRRTATVTISAPDASTAAAFSSKLLYLPVPTISREAKVRPATVQVSAATACGAFTSTTSNEMHDLEPVAVVRLDLRQGRASHDLQVALDGDFARVESDRLEHCGDAASGAHRPGFAVHDYRNHLFASRFSHLSQCALSIALSFI